MFLLIATSSMVLALYVNSLIGRVIVRSRHRKLVSTVLMVVSTLGAVIPILYMSMTNQVQYSEGVVPDRTVLPYFRGFYDVVAVPFHLSTILNFWLPLAIVLVLLAGIVTKIMPNYYKEALYTNAQTKAKKMDNKAKPVLRQENASLRAMLIRHHISTLQNATLLIQTYLTPLVYVVIFLMPSLMGNGIDFSALPVDYFGVALLLGVVLGSVCSQPNSFVGVGISLEKDNYAFRRTLPFNFKTFLRQKFLVLYGLQVGLPALVYLFAGIFLLKLSPLLVLAFLLGFLVMVALQGQLMYKRDYKYLDLKWQDLTQLFTRGSGQWLAFGLVMGSFFIGAILAVATIYIGLATQQMLVVNGCLALLLLVVAISVQFLIRKSFWKKL